jgi:predicted ribosomally synthesized peptide with SipW-like signal peptide
MKKFNKKVASAALASAALCSVMSVGVMSYLYDSASAQNVFTIGESIKDKITLTEPNWKPDDAKNLEPNQTIDKDPTVTNTSDHDVYGFITVTIPEVQTSNSKTYTDLFVPAYESGWTLIDTTEDTSEYTKTYVYAYGSASALTALAKNDSATLFKTVTIEDFTDSAEADNIYGKSFNLDVKSYAIQADSLDVDGDGNYDTAPSTVWTYVSGLNS